MFIYFILIKAGIVDGVNCKLIAEWNQKLRGNKSWLRQTKFIFLVQAYPEDYISGTMLVSADKAGIVGGVNCKVIAQLNQKLRGYKSWLRQLIFYFWFILPNILVLLL